MLDNILDLPSEEQVQPAEGMVAQIAALLRSFQHELDMQTPAEVADRLKSLRGLECEEDTATESARTLLVEVMEAELKRRPASASED